MVACLFFIVYKLMHFLFCLLVGVGSRPSSWVQLTGAGTFFSLHCSGWSLEDLFGRTVTTQCRLADQSNVWVYQEVSCSALECENSCSMYQGVWHSCVQALRNISVYICTYIQWNLSIEDTIRTQLAVLYRKVFLLQR